MDWKLEIEKLKIKNLKNSKIGIDKNLLLYASAALNQLTDELHERRAENRVFLPCDSCHSVATTSAWLRNHVGVARFRRLWISCHRVVQLGEEGEEHLKIVLGQKILGQKILGQKMHREYFLRASPGCLRLS